MIGWIVALSVVGVIFILLISSINVFLEINDRVFLKISILGITLFSYDSENTKTKPKNTKHKKKLEASDEKSLSTFSSLLKEYTKGKNKRELIQELFEIIKYLCIRFKTLLGHFRFKKVVLDLTVATDEAAETAILYGRLCSVIYSIVSLLESSVNFSSEKISVKTDFTSEKFKLILSSTFKIRVCYILGFALSLAVKVIKIKIGDIKNGRT